jgi:hypothetical protein
MVVVGHVMTRRYNLNEITVAVYQLPPPPRPFQAITPTVDNYYLSDIKAQHTNLHPSSLIFTPSIIYHPLSTLDKACTKKTYL